MVRPWRVDDEERAAAVSLMLAVRESQSNPLSKEEDEFLSEETLIRYLRARQGSEQNALKMLNETLAWRRNVCPRAVVCKACMQDGSAHSLRSLGVSNLGHVVFYSQFAGVGNRVASDNIDHLIFKLENVFNSPHVTAESFIWVMDFVGFGAKDMSPSIAKNSISLFQNHYPERLGKGIIIDAPMIFSTLWKALKPFIDANSLEKVSFMKSSQTSAEFRSLFPQNLADRLEREIARSRTITKQSVPSWWTEPGELDFGEVAGIRI